MLLLSTGVSNIRPAGRNRPVPWFNPAREATSHSMQHEEITRPNVIENHEYDVVKNCQHDLVKRDHIIQYICPKRHDKILNLMNGLFFATAALGFILWRRTAGYITVCHTTNEASVEQPKAV